VLVLSSGKLGKAWTASRASSLIALGHLPARLLGVLVIRLIQTKERQKPGNFPGESGRGKLPLGCCELIPPSGHFGVYSQLNRCARAGRRLGR
jgi:hypothetical protein